MKRNFTVSFFGICSFILFVGCSNEVEQSDKFERAAKCRELADRYLVKEEKLFSVRTLHLIVYSEGKKTCLAKVSEILVNKDDQMLRKNGQVLMSEKVEDVLTTRVLASSGITINGEESHWYYDDNNVRREAAPHEVREVMDDLMRE
jgi:hypothetical protein